MSCHLSWRYHRYFDKQGIGPSRLHFDFSKSFFSLGSKRANDKSWEALELSGLIHNGWHSSKNASNLLLVAIGWGSGEVIRSGGEEQCLRRTVSGGCVHHKNGRMLVTNVDTHRITGLAFSVHATDPTDQIKFAICTAGVFARITAAALQK